MADVVNPCSEDHFVASAEKTAEFLSLGHDARDKPQSFPDQERFQARADVSAEAIMLGDLGPEPRGLVGRMSAHARRRRTPGFNQSIAIGYVLIYPPRQRRGVVASCPVRGRGLLPILDG